MWAVQGGVADHNPPAQVFEYDQPVEFQLHRCGDVEKEKAEGELRPPLLIGC
jgi:hypothetical protein